MGPMLLNTLPGQTIVPAQPYFYFSRGDQSQ